MSALIDTYQERKQKFEEKAKSLLLKYNQYAFVRLGLFVLGLGLSIWIGFSALLVSFGFFLVFLIFFYRFILWHQRLKKQETHNQLLAEINANELMVFEAETPLPFENGNAYLDPNHPYALDLDLFGPYSFFQHTNRTTTILGQQRLANCLLQPVDKPTIVRRQEAIAELHPLLDWRQDFQAIGMNTKDELSHIDALKFWLDQPAFVSNSLLLKASLWVIPIWTMLFGIFIAPYNPWYITLSCLIPAGLILQNTLKKVNKIHAMTAKAGSLLEYYGSLIGHIENHPFQSDLLANLQKAFTNNDQKASTSIKKLAYIIEQLNVRYNAFAIFLNLFGLWDLQWIIRLERWQAKHKTQLFKWFESMAAFEALISLSTIYYNNPDWTFPSIHPSPELMANEVGHPLIPSHKRVNNDFRMPLEAHIKLVTGSNMAGKSTFLRTIGLNIVLAMIGAPVCAKRFELPLLFPYTSMRTQDALHESTSSFFAELKRLKFIIEAVEAPDQLFKPYFLLDEILKGTNSKDRHTGGKALIKQLIASQGSGMIATHDLELGVLEHQYNGAIENLCMEVDIIDNQLHFDYKIKKGVSQSFNATLLMQNMGINIGALS